jgi:hypothetical protein
MKESSGFPSAAPVPVDGGRIVGEGQTSVGQTAIVQKSDGLLLRVMLVGLILLAVAGVALLGAYFYVSRQQPPAAEGNNPVEAVRSKSVAPDLAVLELAGEADERVIRAAVDAAEVETAYAELAYGTLLPDSTRAGQWLLLAARYGGAPGDKSARAADPARAALAYQAALDEAALGPGLGDLTRAGISLQVARGMAALGKEPVARLALAQADNIARYSLALLPAQRRDILAQVVTTYRSLGDKQSAAALEAQISTASAGPGVKLPPATDILASQRGSVVLPADLTAAILARQRAAANLAGHWLSASPNTRAELTRELSDALKAEDAAQEKFFGQSSSLGAADQLALLHERIVWLGIKYRVARLGYGLSLVPDWESQVNDIATELASAYTDLINGYGRQLDTLEAGEAATGRLQLLQQGLLWSRLGLFPGHDENTLRGQLIDAARQLWTRRGGAGLVIVDQDVNGQLFYLLSGSDATTSGVQPTATK